MMAARGAALLAAFVVTLSSCAAAGRETAPAPATPADRIQLVEAGFARPLADGDDVPVAGALSATVSVRPLAAIRSARVADIVLRGAGGAPVADASVGISGRMRYMDHGSFTVAATPSGDGHYVAPLLLAMPGSWVLDVTVKTASDSGSIELELDTAQ